MGRWRQGAGWFLTVLTLVSHVTAPFAHGAMAHSPFASGGFARIGQDYCVADPARSPVTPIPATKSQQCLICLAFQLENKLLPPPLSTIPAQVVLADRVLFLSIEATPGAVERFRLPPSHAPPTTSA